MTDYRDRLSGTIKLTSPSGVEFDAKWKGDSRRKIKDVQADRFPGISGEYGKDFGATSNAYTMSIHFDGQNCDLWAKRFDLATSEIGKWTVIHPVHGKLSLLLVSVNELTAPVESGGVVTFELEWFDPLDLRTLQTSSQMVGIIDDMFADLTAANAAYLEANLKANSMATKLSAASAFGVLSRIIDVAGDVAWWASSANSATNVMKARYGTKKQDLAIQISDAQKSDGTLDPYAMHENLAGMAQSVALASADFDQSKEITDRMAADFIKKLPSKTTGIGDEDFNDALIVQASIDAACGAACLAVAHAKRETRIEALYAANSLVEMWNIITNAVDASAENFEDARYDQVYHAQTETYAILTGLVAQTLRYLQVQSLSLAIEKRFVLGEYKTPIQICFEQFGSDGESKIDSFIEWNALEGDDILLLPPGREVVLYVSRSAQ